MKGHLASVDALAAPAAQAIHAHVSPGTLRTIADASGIDWLPIEVSVELRRAVNAVLPAPEFDAFFRGSFGKALQTPVFRAIVESTIAIFGMDPASWTRLMPTGWALLFRNCGAWKADRLTGTSAKLTLHDLPPACVEDDIWARSIGASTGAIVDLDPSRHGGVRFVELDRPAGRAVYEMWWEPKPTG